jgi:putative tryptophan/tyrosine transport system substrate-binding protein
VNTVSSKRLSGSHSDNRKSAIQNPKWVEIVALVIAFTMCAAVSDAQQPNKVARIGYLDGGFASTNAARIDGFRQGLRDLGYIEGKNIIVEYRHSEGKLDRLGELSAELIRLKVDVIVAGGGGAAINAAKQATKTIPIVMPMAIDPVEQGFVTSLAQPNGNITGLATLAPELSGKQLEILKEIVPKLAHVGVFGTSSNAANARLLQEVELAAHSLHLKIQYVDVKTPGEFESAFRATNKVRAVDQFENRQADRVNNSSQRFG